MTEQRSVIRLERGAIGPSRGVVKRSIAIAGHRTSISLEEPFWEELRRIARERGIAVQRLVAEIDEGRSGENLSSALRVFVLEDLRAGQVARADQ
ncbi:MAG: ribbon-helix-helix domain-containing protein [Salinarimonas sp.]|nr:ribbon-helix-helix domain-containing protein [Salinarimonas sp.]